MSLQKAFYKSLGYELMKELAESYVDVELTPCGARGAYQTLKLPNGMHVRFTEWRRGDGPFYIILFRGAKDVFELDLSMIVYRQERFTWHLKVPSHDNNVRMLSDWLSPPAALDDDYSGFVKEVKSSIDSGINTPRTGYRFVGDVEWSGLCDRFLELMRLAIKTHATEEGGSQPLTEAEDDDGQVVGTRRKVRRNQSRFRLKMMELYDGACAISGERTVEVLEAAHIASHSETGVNHSGNGLLLRSDLHRLFDANLIAINPASLQVAVSELLSETQYQKFSGQELRARVDGTGPDPKYLEIRWSQAGLN